MTTEYRKIEDNKKGSLRIVIPKEHAEKLKLKQGDNLKLVLLSDSIIIKKADQ